MTAQYHLSARPDGLFALVTHFYCRNSRTNCVRLYGLKRDLYTHEGRHIVEGRYAYQFEGTLSQMLDIMAFAQTLF